MQKALASAPDFTRIAALGVKGVANISSLQVRQRSGPFQNDPFFRQFFGDQMPPNRPYTQQGSGSGFIIRRDGDTAYVATNAHVVYKADKVEVLLATGRKVDAQVVGTDADLSQASVGGPYKVDGGEVTFSFLTPSLAKIYHAPRAMFGKVFTIYFTPHERIERAELKLGAGFKTCKEQQTTSYYYLVNDAGIAYRLRRSDDVVETIIYQPSRAEVRRLAVTTECVF